MEKEIQIGKSRLTFPESTVDGEFTQIDGEAYYKIANADQMDPFFITIVSNSDHWMFVSSNGGITAGRKNPDNALFPYYTVDKIQEAAEYTGSKTIFLLTKESTTYLWEPFSDHYHGIYNITRNIYKSVYGNKIVFEEVNNDIKISFSYQWMSGERFGFIRRSVVTNIGNSAIHISLLDGIQNIIPAGIDRLLQQAYSNLVDAYKKNELISKTSIGLFLLSAVIVDKAEPSEALQANIVWSTGLEKAKYLLSEKQLNNFRKGKPITEETDIRAARGAYFINSELSLTAGQQKDWHIVADVNQDAGDIAKLKSFLTGNLQIVSSLQKDVEKGNGELLRIVAAADGIQLTNDNLSVNRHLSNVLFNVMRGGIPDDNYAVSKVDLLNFIKQSNQLIYNDHLSFFKKIDELEQYNTLLEKVQTYNNTQLVRLVYEYLPFTFSRRHGDPSRPWNQFSIELKNEDGSKKLYYAGNWRDIFQNWEALGLSYPMFVEGMICKFLNASTADGYNPYRITKDGIDWEKPDPHDPWANIGYWGDHQIIYLLKFLEISKQHNPGVLQGLVTKKIFSYANVPYRVKPYDMLVKDPFDTIEFSEETEKQTNERVAEVGSDGKLLWDESGNVHMVNLAEKILATVLAKLSNFIPEAGIWLNTQRPEWNDANNALVGNGVSMVTLYYLRRFQKFCIGLFENAPGKELEISKEMADFLQAITGCFSRHEHLLGGSFSDTDRKVMVDELGMAGSQYRQAIYTKGFSGEQQQVDIEDLQNFFAVTIKYIDHSIKKNKRADNLYHAYNLVTFTDDMVSIDHLYEMLEGQVAVLSSGMLNAEEAIDVIDALKASALFREDQYSYLLYPDRQLHPFMEKNIIPESLINKSALCKQLMADKNKKIVYRDVEGVYHFSSSFRNAGDLEVSLNSLKQYHELVTNEKQLLLQMYEEVFEHRSFTGRSGTFYGFEGLGCIYWHMVSKLLLAINENYFSALQQNADDGLLGKLIKHYYDVRAGIGLNKSPGLFGAFPTDAYSHTPGNGGAKQPGMTGQVKEDIISRFGELGVIVENGKISFNPGLLRNSEFLTEPQPYDYISLHDRQETIKLQKGNLAFTLCQVPVVYHIDNENRVMIRKKDNEEIKMEGLVINEITSAEIFSRTGVVKEVHVFLMPRLN